MRNSYYQSRQPCHKLQYCRFIHFREIIEEILSLFLYTCQCNSMLLGVITHVPMHFLLHGGAPWWCTMVHHGVPWCTMVHVRANELSRDNIIINVERLDLVAGVTKRWCWINKKNQIVTKRKAFTQRMHKGIAPFTKINWYFILYTFTTTQYFVDNTQKKISFLSINKLQISKRSLCINLRYIAWQNRELFVLVKTPNLKMELLI